MTKKEVLELLDSMSLEEKIGQMVQLNGDFYQKNMESVLTGPASEIGVTQDDIKLAGSILSTYGAEKLKNIQKEYMENHPHHIPMLFMMDVIHGMKTIFPMPLAQGATFEPELSKKCAKVAAKEAAVTGLHVTFAPMADLVRDARWGRVMESTGEDAYLNSLFATAMVEGFQGDDMGKPDQISACVKHFAAYGAPSAGRDYNTVELTEHTLRQFYLPAYEAAIKAGAGMVMTSFNTVNGIPASTNQWLMKKILREEMGFDGVLISDYAAILETIAHGYATDEKDAAKKALEAGVDIDMMTSVYAQNLKELVEEGSVEERWIDECVLRILELKNKLGLFENPYKDADAEREKELLLCKEHRELAREAAGKSFVLLKNEGILPLKEKKKIAFVGPYTKNKEIKSCWSFTGDSKDCVTIEEAAREVFDDALTTYHQGTTVVGNEMYLFGFNASDQDVQEEMSREEEESCLKEAIKAAKEAEIVVMPLGEHYLQSGEAASRAMLEIPQVQLHLLREVAKVNENIVVVLFNGRPLDLREITKTAKAVLEVWLPGSEGGHAIVDVLTGKRNPSGKLPMSFPYCVGQVPVHYNEYATGRPNRNDLQEKFRSRYLDIPNEPLYPFGYGLSYTTFDISDITMSSHTMTKEQKIIASVNVRNTGTMEGVQVIQFYMRDVAASVVRPVKELKGFEKITLAPGAEKKVSFTIDQNMLEFLRVDDTVGCEPGKFQIWIGDSSITQNSEEFVLEPSEG